MRKSVSGGRMKFEIQTSLGRSEPYDLVLEINGAIIGEVGQAGDAQAEDEEVIGEVQALLVLTSQAMNDGANLADVCDAHSQWLQGAYAAVFSHEYETREELEIEPTWEGFLYIHVLTLKPDYDAPLVKTQAIDATIRCFCPAGIIVADKDRMSLSVEQWKQLGFKSIAGKRYAFQDKCSLNPYGLEVPDTE